MALTVFYGPGAVQKKQELLKEILSQRAQNMEPGDWPGVDFLVAVPTERWVESLRQRIWDSTANTSLYLYPPVYNFSALTHYLYQRIVGQQKIFIDDNTQETLLRFALNKLCEEGLVKQIVGRQSMIFPNTIRELKKFIIELKQNGVTQERLEYSLKRLMPGDAGWHDELQQIFAFYEQMLAAHNLIDEPTMEQEVAKALNEKSLHSVFPSLSRAFFMGFDLFSVNMLRFVEKLAGSLPEVLLLLVYEPDRPELFGHIEPSFSRLSQMADQVINVPINENLSTEKMAFLQNFYRRTVDSLPLQNLATPAFKNIKIAQAATRREEVKFIARYVKSLFLQAEQAGQPLHADRIGLCFPHLELYAPLINEIFSDYGIPYDIAIGQPLSQSLVVNTVLNMLQMVAANYHRRELFRFLNSPYVNLELLEGHFKKVDKGLLNSISIRSFIVEGREQWIEAVDAELKHLQKKIEDAWQGQLETGEDDGFDLESLQQRQAAASQLKTNLENLFEKLKVLEQPITLDKHVSELLQLIDYLQLSERILAVEKKGVESKYLHKEFAAWQRFIRLLNQLRSFAPYLAQRILTVDEFLAVLGSILSECYYRPPKQEVESVKVLGRLEPRGLEFDYLIIGGLVESEFPKPFEAPLFLRPSLMKSLGLPDVYSSPLAPDLFLFYLYLTETKDSVLLTYPAAHGDEPLLPSMVIEELSGWGVRIESSEAILNTKYKYSLRELESFIGGWDSSIDDMRQANVRQVQPRSPSISTETREALLKINLIREPTLHNIELGLNAEQQRASLQRFTPYEGQLISPAVVEKCREEVTHTVFSVSQLEQYAHCPFAYFCERVLNIAPPEEFEEEMTPLERGALVHNILFRFYSELRDKGKTIFDASQMEGLYQQFLNIAQEVSQHYFYRGLLWENQKEKLFGSTWRPGLLRVFIETEAQRFSRSQAFQPTYFEISFGGTPEGKKYRDPISTPRPFEIKYKSAQLGHRSGEDGRLLLRGKIDRIDIADDRFVVIDYKTSATLPGTREIESGLSLQLPLYLLAASEILKQQLGKKLQGIGACFYQVRDETHCKIRPQLLLDTHVSHFEEKRRKIVSQNAAEFNGLLNIARELAIQYVEQMKQGYFSPVPAAQGSSDPCRHCPYRRACRVNLTKATKLRVPGI